MRTVGWRSGQQSLMGTIVRCLLTAEDKLGARPYTLAAILIAILSAYCLVYERSILGLSATMAIIAFSALVTGRLLFPAVLLATTASTIVAISAVKHSILQVAFMLPDIILVANPEMFFYMWSSELTGYMTALTLVLVASGVLLGITIWRDRTKIRRKWATLALLISLVTGYMSKRPGYSNTSALRATWKLSTCPWFTPRNWHYLIINCSRSVKMSL